MIHPSLQHPPLEMNLWLRGVLGLFPLMLWGAQRSHRCWPKYRMTVHGEHANALTLQGQNPNSASPEAACAIKLAHTLVQRISGSGQWTFFTHIERWGPNQLPAHLSGATAPKNKVHGVTPSPSRKDGHIAQQSIPASGIRIPRRSKPFLLLYRITERFGLKRTLKFIWFQTPCCGQRYLPLDQVTQRSIQLNLKHCHMGHAQLLWPTCSSPHQPHSKISFLRI